VPNAFSVSIEMTVIVEFFCWYVTLNTIIVMFCSAGDGPKGL
jgi:hypothetical protein